MPREDLVNNEGITRKWVNEFTSSVDKINDFYLLQVSTIVNQMEGLKQQIKRVQVILGRKV